LPPGIAAYPELFAVVGGAVPDLRGLFLRGYGSQAHAQNNGSTVGVTPTTHSSGALRAVQGDVIRNISGVFPVETENYQHGWSDISGAFYVAGAFGSDGEASDEDHEYRIGFDASRVVPVATEVRPINMAVRYLIRALP
jgi:hypothetical protein